MMRIKFVFFTLVVFSQSLCALQRIAVEENVAMPITASHDDMTRIYVRDDAITDVWTTTSYFNIQQDVEHGEIYLTMKETVDFHPVSLMLKTEKGDRIDLVVSQTKSGAETVEIKTIHDTGIIKSGASQQLTSQLANILQIIYDGKVPPGFQVSTLAKTATSNEANLTHTKTLTGKNWCIDIFSAVNQKENDIVIHADFFNDEDIIAFSTTKTYLRPSEEAMLYVVRANHE